MTNFTEGLKKAKLFDIFHQPTPRLSRNQQTNKQTNKRTNKQTNKQAERQTGKQTRYAKSISKNVPEMASPMRFEPTTSGLKVRRANHYAAVTHVKLYPL